MLLSIIHARAGWDAKRHLSKRHPVKMLGYNYSCRKIKLLPLEQYRHFFGMGQVSRPFH